MNASVLAPRRHICQPAQRTNTWIPSVSACHGFASSASLQSCQCSNSTTQGVHGHSSSSVRLRATGFAVSQLLKEPRKKRLQCHSIADDISPSSSEIDSHGQPTHTTWTSADGTVFQVIQMHAQQSSSSSKRPAVVLIHGLFRAAWYWQDSLMPALAQAGFDSYALSLRGQGSSQLYPSQPQAAADGSASQQGASEHHSRPFAHGVPLAVNVADIAAFISSRGFTKPPVLVGHSLGGMFVQEYLHQLHRQQQSTTASAPTVDMHPSTDSSSNSSSTGLPHLSQPVPQISGAVLLASACAGTVMSFDRFIADVGLLEFLYQMYIVFSCAHLNDLTTARYCWWQDSMDEAEAAKHLEAIKASSTALPYVTKEVGGWHPAPPKPEALQQLPPVLALGGAADRIIRPFQVSAAKDYWGADVVVMDGVTHDMLLGPQASAVSQQLLSWLQEVPLVAVRAVKPTAISGGGPGYSMDEQLSVQWMASTKRQ